MYEETALFARYPWMSAIPDFSASGIPAASAIAGMQRAWIESAAAAMKGVQAMMTPRAHPGQAASNSEAIGLSSFQEATKSAQDIGSAMLDANMKAFEIYVGRCAGVWGEMTGLAREVPSGKTPVAKAPAKAFETATKTALEGLEKSQETSSKAWIAMQKRLAEGIKEWNEATSAWSENANVPSGIKESYRRLASDSGGLFEVIQKTNASALSLMQRRFTAEIDEMARQYPGRGTEKLQAATQAYEKAANAISEALLRANKEAMEALQSWSTESQKGEKTSAEQRAA